MRRPDQHALADAAPGRVTMPFLPTLAVVAALGLASLYCPSPRAPAAVEPAAAVPALASPGPIAFGRAATDRGPARRPASLAFAEFYPLAVAAPAVTGSIASVQDATAAAAGQAIVRPGLRLAAAARRPCPGRHCPETPLRGPGPAVPQRAATSEAPEPTEGVLPPAALPFAAVAQTLAPAARAVGDAADFLRGGASSVRGAVALAVADCLR